MIIFIYFGSRNFSTDGGALLRCTYAECVVLIGSHHHKKHGPGCLLVPGRGETHAAWTANRLSPCTWASPWPHCANICRAALLTLGGDWACDGCDAAYHVAADGCRAIERGDGERFLMGCDRCLQKCSVKVMA